jgi:Cu+-exporting ATPase
MKHSHHLGKERTMKTATIDPVCGMTVSETSAAGTSNYQGTTYLFCCSQCKRKFDEKPEQYLRHELKAIGDGCACGCGPS